jgi:hypothetical protein
MPIRIVESFRAVFYTPFYLPHVLGAYEAKGLDVDLGTSPAAAWSELERLLDTLIRRITRTLVQSRALVAQEYNDGEQHWLDLDADGEIALTQLQDVSVIPPFVTASESRWLGSH